MNDLRADVKNLDADSGYEEELLSDESFAGAISIGNKNGAFGTKLHEHDKYNGSLRARKSVFFFENRVVALGSNIHSDLPGKTTHTTFFQVLLPLPNKSICVNGKNIVEFPYFSNLKSGNNYLSDGQNNYFFVKQGDIMVSKSLQKSLDEETDALTQNNFVLAAINHGIAPQNANYEYMALIQPTVDEVNTTTKQFNSPGTPLYLVLQQDSLAHIVADKATKTTGYILFEAGKLQTKTDIVSVSAPCMIMTSAAQKGRLTISVCDPDLHFYEGPSDDKFDANGKRIERSIYSRKWINNPSRVSEIKVVLNGEWTYKLGKKPSFINIFNVSNGKTSLIVTCQHGLSREIDLIK